MSDTPSDSLPGGGGGSLRTRFCDLVGCDLPVVQTGMGWVSGARLTAATSAAGGFGILAAVTMTPDQLEQQVHEVKARTDRPFGVNFRADQPDLAERLAFVVREGVRLVSFAGAPTKDAVARCHDAGVLVMPTCGARRHAEKVAEMGVDAVIAQGGEGGGHTGVVPTSLLLPSVVDAVGDRIPVLGAGGFHDGRGLVAALAWGADGIAMGTRFLLTQESRVPDAVKDVYLATAPTGTVVTTALDGAPQRVIRTDVVDRIERSPALLRFPRALAAALAVPQGHRHAGLGARARGPGHEAEPGPDLVAGGAGGQRADAHPGDDGGGPARGRRAADRPGHRRRRRRADRGRPPGRDPRPGRVDPQAPGRPLTWT